ncbi:GyrI-like domain-containing protein [Arthrobacter sp. NPDC058288]|uniref:GyrI-like domain-containing protein n=1 Tax=Arthrobacter sp. NPDC058288 TaxID=3346424 RepID=UPI0036E98FA1
MSQDKTGIRLVQRPEQATAVVREKVPMNELPEFFGRAFGAVMAAARDQDVQIAGPPFGLYRGMPTDTVDVEAGFPVTAPLTASGGVETGTLPACRAFEATHTGPYDTLVTTYNDIQARMKEEGFNPADSMWEYYLSDPATEPDPATWRTLVVWPVA